MRGRTGPPCVKGTPGCRIVHHQPPKFKQPNTMTICDLEVLLMPNGEVLFEGRTIGWFDRIGQYLTPRTVQR